MSTSYFFRSHFWRLLPFLRPCANTWTELIMYSTYISQGKRIISSIHRINFLQPAYAHPCSFAHYAFICRYKRC